MTKINDIINYFETFAPICSAMDFDNVGLLVGDKNKEISKVLVTLDITKDVVIEAESLGCELIISHHPVIFKAQKNFLKGNVAFNLASKGISAICAHTCLDCAEGGVNDVLADLLEIENTEIFPCEESPNLVRVGVLPEAMSCDELAQKIKSELGGCVRYNDNGKMIESVALCGGSGGDFIGEIIKAGIDAYITGDAGHHHFLDCAEGGVALFAAGHFETENPVISSLANRLRCEFSDIDITIIPQKSPVKYI